MKYMISVKEAKQIVGDHAKPLDPVWIPLVNASGNVAAADIYSPISMPGFRQSSMDGYAIQLKNINDILFIQDELPAGTSKQLELKEGHAIKVFTGGPVPLGADVVIQKEWVVVLDNAIKVEQKTKELGLNIREQGSSVNENDWVITKGTCFNSYQLAMLASLGITQVLVYPTPSIALIITGNELVKPGESLDFGQVYESNSIGLVSVLNVMGVKNITVLYAKDVLMDTATAIHQALEVADMIILTGGVSVGEYDYVAEACKMEGVTQLLHGIKQKPGKPMYVGKHQKKLVFGLPGNPSSVLHCFQQYVKPAIEWTCVKQPAIPLKAMLANDFNKKQGLDFFLKAILKEGVVEILPSQASYQVGAFSNANCWVELPAEESFFIKGDTVTVHLF